MEVRLTLPPELDEYTLRAARRGSRPAREAVLTGCLPLVYTLAVRAGLDETRVEAVVRATLAHVVAGLAADPDPAALHSRALALASHQIGVARPPDARPEDTPEADPLDLLRPPPHLADLAARLARSRSAPRGGPDGEPVRPGRLAGIKPVAAALVGLILVAGAEMAVVFGTRADGGTPPATVTAEPPSAPHMSSNAPSLAKPSPSGSHFVPVPPGGLPSAPPFFTQVPAIPTVVSALNLGAIRQPYRVVARDNGQSTAYGNRSVWIFSDTVLQNPKGFISSSAAITGDLHAADGITLATPPANVLPNSPVEQAFEAEHRSPAGCTNSRDQYCGTGLALWPGPVVADPARHRVLIFYQKVCRGGVGGTPCSGIFGKLVGSGVAAMSMDTGAVTRLTVTNGTHLTSLEGADPTLFFPAWASYAAAAEVIGDVVYVYGDCGTACKLARVPLAQIGNRSRWQFFTGRDAKGTDRWSSDPARAVDTIAAGAAGNTVLWSPALHGYLNIFMPFASNTLMFQIGGSPFGPWSSSYPLLATIAIPGRPNYAAFGHAEYAERGGLIQYISYYQAYTGIQQLVKVIFLG